MRDIKRYAIAGMAVLTLVGCSPATLHEDAAKRLEETGDLPGAITEYVQAVEGDKTNVNLRTSLVNAYMKNNQFNEAVEHAKIASSLDPRNGKLHLLYGKALEKKGAENEALAEYQNAFTCDDKMAEPCLLAGKIFETRKDFKSAVTQYRQAVKAEPNSAEAHESLAQALSNVGDMANANAESKEASRLRDAKPAS